MRRRVVCGLSETIATLPPQSAFTSVDLPTFGRPATATKPLSHAALPDRAAERAEATSPTLKGGGARPPTHTASVPSEPTHVRSVPISCRFVTRQLPGVGQQLGRRVRDDLAGAVGNVTRSSRNSYSHWRQPPHGDAVIPIASRSPGRQPAATAPRDRRLLRADAERVRRVLDVDALEDAAVARAHGRADEVARVRRVRPRRATATRPLDELSRVTRTPGRGRA